MLKDKVAVVTGAGRGIGREIAKTFAGYGAKVVVNFNGSEERANSLVEEIKAAGGEAVAFKANVADFAEAEALMKFAVATYGRIDILVNNAGITRDNLVLGMKEADFDDVININLKGTFNCIKHVYRTMMKQKYGRIINMSSVVGITGLRANKSDAPNANAVCCTSAPASSPRLKQALIIPASKATEIPLVKAKSRIAFCFSSSLIFRAFKLPA